jgi:hypothetical protein
MLWNIHVTADAILITRQLNVYERLSELHKFDERSFNTVNKLSSCIDSEDTVNVLPGATI